MIEISVVIPVYRSEANLPELCKQLDQALGRYTREIILINDGSPDASWETIRQLAGRYPEITGINLRKNYGQDNAIMAGLRHASGTYIVIMDDDLQHSPHDIPQLVDACRTGYDIVYARFREQRQAAWKRFGSWLNGKAAELLIGKPRDIYLSPFAVVRGEVATEVAKYEGPFPYVQGLLFNVTTNITQIDIDHHPRFKGKSNFNLVRSISVFLKLATSFSVIPLRIASIVGIAVALAGFLLVPYYLYEYFYLNYVIEGWTTLVLLGLIIGGFTLMSLGLIGEYLGRIYLSVNKKPQQIIREIFSSRGKR